MKIEDKVERAKQAIKFITDHDDAPQAEMAAAVKELKQYADAELKQAAARRSSKKAGDGQA